MTIQLKNRVLTRTKIQARIHELAKSILNDYQDKELVVIGVLKGAFIVTADLVRALEDIRIIIDFIQVSSYGQSQTSSGTVKIIKDIAIDIKDKHVLLVEDILDTGVTIDSIVNRLKKEHPKSIKIFCLIDNQKRRKMSVPVDYIGFSVKSGFLVGYGLDYQDNYRQLQDIYELSE
ncbi:hypoxanthine phosphoribosyltransferase [Thermoproteota archaeon]